MDGEVCQFQESCLDSKLQSSQALWQVGPGI